MINDSLQAYICGGHIEPREYVETEPETLISIREVAVMANLKAETMATYRTYVPARYAEKGLTVLPKGIRAKGERGRYEFFYLKHKIEEWVKLYKRIKRYDTCFQ